MTAECTCRAVRFTAAQRRGVVWDPNCPIHGDGTLEPRPCMVCGDPLTFRTGRGWRHAGGGLYVQRCTLCGWTGAPETPLQACPRCGRAARVALVDDHCAQPRFS